MSSALRLVDISGKGRGFVATEPLKGGQVILRESPILVFSAYPLKRSRHPTYCAHCYRTFPVEGSRDQTPLTCPSCCHPEDAAQFCSTTCHSAARSSTHSPWVCASLNYLRNCSSLLDNQAEERQVQARYLVTAYNLAIVSPSDFQTLMSLHGDGERYIDIAKFLQLIISSLSFPGELPDLSVEMIAGLLDKETNNSFNLMEPVRENGERGIRAYAIYPTVSFFNHSCMPNACRFEYLDGSNIENNTDIVIRTMHDVPQGEEICLSYVRVNRNYIDRKKRLLDYFGFNCLCERCKVEANNESNWGEFARKFVCENEKCGGTLAPLNPSEDGYSADCMECNYCGSLTNRK
ncbi:hypothetical protein RND81_03G195900 [Saponaria officinalis]|uniref:SET domain-containing protein n=1 Tax=Saponaria officinalis TaxID=3572 RepID=A0AAW1M8H3_SAPOF